jgi:hypothetical protein
MEPVARQIYNLHTANNGKIVGNCWTNDDEDTGYPNVEASWEVSYRDRAHMEKSTGRSHVGISGVQVEVILDGKKI